MSILYIKMLKGGLILSIILKVLSFSIWLAIMITIIIGNLRPQRIIENQEKTKLRNKVPFN